MTHPPAGSDALRTLDLAPAAVKACCVDAYESDLVGLLLGESYHPGGMELTRRLVGHGLALQPGEHVVDVASGQGTSAIMLAEEFGVRVTGVDLSELLIEEATARAAQARLTDRVEFLGGDAERLPVDTATVDAIICECAFCTFPDKETAASEFSRVLKPGGRVGITDVVVDPGGLSDNLQTLTGWVSCLADARPLEVYVELLENAGLVTRLTERHDDAIATMIDQIDARLRVLRMTGAAADLDLDMHLALHLIGEARDAVQAGTAGYALLTAHKPT